MSAQSARQKLRRDMIVAGACGVFVAAMVGASFAAVPFYNWFCRTTGFAGTPQVAESAPDRQLSRTIAVRFDANVDPNLPWTFRPEQVTETVKLGQRRMAFFYAKNNSDVPVTGQASFNVSPDQTGSYFNKVQCFCFTQQTLQPGEEVHMPVLFFVDPAIAKDPDAAPVQQITLSYSFHRSPDVAQ